MPKQKQDSVLENQISSFTDLTPRERQLFIAEIYHNAWYSEERYLVLSNLYKQWLTDPIKEKVFLNEQTDSL